MRRSAGRARGPTHSGLDHVVPMAQLVGQAASIALATSGIDLPLPNQSTIAFHSAPEPTAAGMASEASNRNVAVGSARYFAEILSTGSVYRVWSTFWLADTQPEATLIRLFAHSGLDR